MSEPAYTTSSTATKAPPKPAAPSKKAASAGPQTEIVQVLVHPKNPKITVAWEYITPLVARHYLDKLPVWQRTESEVTTNAYVGDMEAGDWLDTAAPIRFTEQGELMDGQHRLNAIGDSGEAQYVLVARGLSREVMPAIDNGRQRSFGDYLAGRKVPNRQLVSGLTGKILDWKRGLYANSRVSRTAQNRFVKAKKSPSQLKRVFEAHEHEILKAVQVGAAFTWHFPKSVAPSTVSFVFFYLNRLDTFKAAQFFDELTEKCARSSTDLSYPITSLARKLRTSQSPDKANEWSYIAWFFRAWNEFLAEQLLSDTKMTNSKKPPAWNHLILPDDPKADSRPEGWSPL